MRTISISVPDMLADRFEAASDTEKLVWAYRLATVLDDNSLRGELTPVLNEISAWQAENNIPSSAFEQMFAELSSED